jgi:hypothetical protein
MLRGIVRKLAFCVLGGLIFTVLISTAVIVLAGQTPSPNINDTVDIPEKYHPGNTLPHDATCDWHPASEKTLYCYVEVNGAPIYMAYDMARNKILDVAATAHDATVGDLITAWGRPTGVIRWSVSVQVFWGTRSAYVMSGAFTPSSHASFISYSTDVRDVEPWQGFRNRPVN